MLLRAKIGCVARIVLMSLISPLAPSVNWMTASPFSMPWRIASFGNAASPITALKFEQTTAAEIGAGGAAGAGAAAGATGVMLVTAGGVRVDAVIVCCTGGGAAICTSGGGMNGGGGAASTGGGGTTISGGGGGFLISSMTLVSIGARTTSTTFFARPVTSA